MKIGHQAYPNRRLQVSVWTLAVLLHLGAAGNTATADATAPSTASSIPRHAVFTDTWVQRNVAITYSPETTRDGLGAQAFRMLGIYAISKALGLPYLNTPPECVGHIGGAPHYQGTQCSPKMTAADQKQLSRVQRMLQLPGSPGITPASTRSWRVERLDDVILTWQALRNATEAALQHKRPTLIKLARVQALLCQHPGVFLAVPQLKPSTQLPKLPQHRPWLLRSVRVAVHMRRGDITTNVQHLRRLLPLKFYINVIHNLTQSLEALGHDVITELYTDRPATRGTRRELAALRGRFPGIILLAGTDDIWNYQQMATADIVVLSLSMYSVVPALLNPNALVIGPLPQALDGKPMSVMRMPHWFNASDHNGTLPAEVMQHMEERFGRGAKVKAKPAPALL